MLESSVAENAERSMVGKDCRKRRKRVDSTIETAVDALFEKRYEICGDYKLPDADAMFIEPIWNLERLQRLKRDLNEVKSKLNDYNLSEWNSHTRRRNKAGEVLRRMKDEFKVEYPTQAWCKFYENASLFPLASKEILSGGKFLSVHLCEAPGAFVAALNHWLKSEARDVDWSWLATTLNPHYEGHSLAGMVKVDDLINETETHWHYGDDDTGDLTSLANLDSLLLKAGRNEANLVTADGSVDCVDTPGEQELVVSHLHYCETVAALQLLAEGANFLIKVFTIFENRSVCLMYLLACCFDRIIVNKPVNSKEGNSETYVICLAYSGPRLLAAHLDALRRNYEKPSDNSMFRRDDIPIDFLDRIVECAEFFEAHQCEAILANMRTFGEEWDAHCVEPDLKEIKRVVARRFVRSYRVKALASPKLRIGGEKPEGIRAAAVSDYCRLPNSYNSRRKERNLDPGKLLDVRARELDLAMIANEGDNCKLDDVPCSLAIRTGKPYEKIQSSKFCAAQTLRAYNESMKLGKELGFSSRIPTSQSIETFMLQESSSESTVLSFDYTSAPDNHALIERLRDALGRLEKDRSLVLLGYNLLSRLSVGLLYVLARAFVSVEITASEKLGCVVTLATYKKHEEVTRALDEIHEASRDAIQRARAVLTVLPIKTLLGSSQYGEIAKMNHGIMRYCVRHVMASITELDQHTV